MVKSPECSAARIAMNTSQPPISCQVKGAAVAGAGRASRRSTARSAQPVQTGRVNPAACCSANHFRSSGSAQRSARTWRRSQRTVLPVSNARQGTFVVLVGIRLVTCVATHCGARTSAPSLPALPMVASPQRSAERQCLRLSTGSQPRNSTPYWQHRTGVVPSARPTNRMATDGAWTIATNHPRCAASFVPHATRPSDI